MLIDFICTFLFHRPHWLCRSLLRPGMKIPVHTSCVRKLSLLPRTSPGSYPGNGGPGMKMLELGSWFPKITTYDAKLPTSITPSFTRMGFSLQALWQPDWDGSEAYRLVHLARA